MINFVRVSAEKAGERKCGESSSSLAVNFITDAVSMLIRQFYA